MKKMRIALALAAATCMSTLAPNLASAETVKIAAMDPGGSWYSYSATFSKVIQDNTDLTVEVIPRGGGFANPTSVNMGKAEFGWTTSNAAVWARDGLESIYKGKKAENIRTVTNGLQTAYTIVLARKGYIESTGFKSLDEMLKASTPPKIGMKPNGSQVPVIADMIFQSLGTSLDELRDKGIVTQATPGQLSSMLEDGRLDVYIDNVPAGQATVTEMTLTTDVDYIPLSDATIAALNKQGLPTQDMPKGTFRGLDQDYKTAVSDTVFLANKDVPEDTVYTVLSTLVKNRSFIVDQHAPLKAWNPEASCNQENAVLTLHPGAVKFCKEQGWLK
ncbi:TAXI family TRAP transporter solute-binding subunit [Consotaella salsifontis]|uniref:TRAP transporter solute receptor, TAXI family n=1 Tax=Consotaella salsifontis TaxID=1365950 RepID=A0A1T4T1U1_9HYPH|nr:TAXI family TRAP transporter solute-binding subunit [Consotaella salsifontis]SKA34339.1 hypothetical protein SAMN05428963_11719 [Consotaella salsifontis]